MVARRTTNGILGHLLGLATIASPALANINGNDSQIFNPALGASDFVTVQSATSLNPGRFSLGLFFNNAVNSLPYADGEHQDRAEMNDSLTGMDVGIGVGIWGGLELGLSLPFVVGQSVKDDQTRGEFEEKGNTDIRAGLKYSFLRSGNAGLAVLASGTVNRTRENPYSGQSTTPVYNLELAGDMKASGVTLGANIGYRFREPGEPIEGSLVEPIANQALASVAALFPVTYKTGIVTEIYSQQPIDKPVNGTDRSVSSAEALVGVKHNFNPTLVGHAGAGTEMMHGLSTPDWRLYAGIKTEFGPDNERGKIVAKKKKKAKKPAKEPVYDEEYGYEPENETVMASLPSEEPDEVFILRDIKFEFDSDYRVLPGASSELDKLQRHLEKNPATHLVVEGHTDYMGTDEYNNDLSTRRARTVRRAMIKSFGLDPNMIQSVGYGEYQPITNDSSDAGRQLNRRVEIKIYRD